VVELHAAKHSQLLSEAIDEGLAILGPLPKHAIYEELEVDFNMRKVDIPTRFYEFSSILCDTLGPSGESILDFIIERFYEGLGNEPKRSIDLGENRSRLALGRSEEKLSIQTKEGK
jgi:hypothetical protein